MKRLILECPVKGGWAYLQSAWGCVVNVEEGNDRIFENWCLNSDRSVLKHLATEEVKDGASSEEGLKRPEQSELPVGWKISQP